MWHYILLTFDSQRLSAPFYYYPSAGPKASIDSRWPPSSDSISMFQKSVHFKIRWSPASVLLLLYFTYLLTYYISTNDRQIHQQQGDRPTVICNNAHEEQPLSIPLPSCSSWLPKAELSPLHPYTLLSAGIIKYVNIALDLFHDMMT